MKNVRGILLFALMLAGGAMKAQLPPGILDLSYGPAGGGWTVAGFPPAIGSKADAVVLQPDGKAIVGGWSTFPTPPEMYTSLARFDTNGILDPSFGTGGMVTINLAPSTTAVWPEQITALAFDTFDQSILAAGRVFRTATLTDIFVCRFDKHGYLVPTFGNNQGCRIIDVNSEDNYPSGVALDAKRRIVICATTVPTGIRIPILLRLMPDGGNDASFGIGGYVGFADCFDCESKGVAVQPDQMIVTAGDGLDTSAAFDAGKRDPFVIRVTESGVRDAGFAKNGLFLADVVSGEETVEGMGLYTDGRIMLIGTALTQSPAPVVTDYIDLLVVRLRTDGWLDPACGSIGPLLGARVFPIGPDSSLTPPLGNADVGLGMIVDPKNYTVVGGYNGGYAIMAAIDPDCELETGFGPYGSGATYLRYNMHDVEFTSVGIDSTVFPYRLIAAGKAQTAAGMYAMTAARFGGYPHTFSGIFEPARLRVALETYPNPCNDSDFYVMLNAPENLLARFELYDMAGRVVGGWGPVAISEGPQSIRFVLPPRLPAGVYSLNLIAAEGFGSVLLIKGW